MKKYLLISFLSVLFYTSSAQLGMTHQVSWKCSVIPVGDSLKISFKAIINEGVDMYSQNNESTMPMVFTFDESTNYGNPARVVEIIAPEVKYDKIFEDDVRFWKKNADFEATVLRKDKSAFSIKGAIDYQICFDSGMCVLENFKFDIPVN